MPGICGGSPKIIGTRFTVRSVVTYILKLGMTPEELVDEFPHLILAQVHNALSYYYEYADEIHKKMEENTEEYWQNKLNFAKVKMNRKNHPQQEWIEKQNE